jgi:hypothetical protein
MNRKDRRRIKRCFRHHRLPKGAEGLERRAGAAHVSGSRDQCRARGRAVMEENHG